MALKIVRWLGLLLLFALACMPAASAATGRIYVYDGNTPIPAPFVAIVKFIDKNIEKVIWPTPAQGTSAPYYTFEMEPETPFHLLITLADNRKFSTPFRIRSKTQEFSINVRFNGSTATASLVGGGDKSNLYVTGKIQLVDAKTNKPISAIVRLVCTRQETHTAFDLTTNHKGFAQYSFPSGTVYTITVAPYERKYKSEVLEVRFTEPATEKQIRLPVTPVSVRAPGGM